MSSGYIPPRPPAQKPTASKPAAQAASKPAATPSSRTTVSGGYSGIPETGAKKRVVSSSNQAAIDTANKKLLADQKLLNDYLNQLVSGGGATTVTGGDTIVNPGNRSDASYVAEGRSGTSNTGKRYINGQLVSESDFNKFLYGDQTSTGGQTGGQTGDATTESAPTRTLALDTFKATLGLLFGKDEVNKAYIGKLYSLVSGFYKSGSEIEDSINLALYQAESENAIPEFTSRFAGIFALRDAKQKGAAISVPTIAEFFATEAKMGEILTGAGLGELATESFLGGVIGRQKSVNEVATLISDVFYAIDYAPKEIKSTLSTYFPGVDRTSLAKAILTGTEGAAELSQKVKGVSVLGAAQQYGITVDLPTAIDIANRGYDYNAALAGFGQVSSLGRATELANIGGTQFTQQQAQSAVFAKSPAELAQISNLKNLEEARFLSSSGNMRGSFSTQYLNRSSNAGQF